MTVLMLAGLMGAAASPAMAESNFYLAAEAGQSTAVDGCNGTPAGVSCKDTDSSYRIAGGYQFSPNLAAEVGYVDLGKATFSGTYLGINLNGDWKATGFDVVLVGSAPMGNNFSFIGKVGFAQTDVKLSVAVPGRSAGKSSTGTTARFGVGLQYDFTKTVAGRVQYDDFGKLGDDNSTGTAKVHVIGAGLTFKF